MDFDSIIIGAGAAGLMYAYQAAKLGLSVFIIDHKREFGQKLLASGGGRCNFTNAFIDARSYVSENPDFVKSALARFKPADFISLLDLHRISYVEEEGGKFFLKGSSRQVRDMLISGAVKHGAKIAIGKISSVEKKDRFVVRGAFGEVKAKKLVIATGGLSYPALGATDFGYRIAKKFGHRIVPCRPALVPLVLSAIQQRVFSKLSGVSFRAGLEWTDHELVDDCLITHKGLSGPAVLRASLRWQKGERLVLDVLPHVDLLTEFERKRASGSRMRLATLLSLYLPDRLARTICKEHETSQPLAAYSQKELRRLSEALHSLALDVTGTEGYAKAEVTLGGVDTRELSSKTMESRKCPGLYFVGEVMDVTGDLGGFNLHWAWASAFAAASSSSI